MTKAVVLAFLLGSAVAISMAASIGKRETKEVTRPEAPLLQDCEEPGENRENCFLTDPANLEIFQEHLVEVQQWETANPEAAKEFNEKNPAAKKEEQEQLGQLEKFAKVHE